MIFFIALEVIFFIALEMIQLIIYTEQSGHSFTSDSSFVRAPDSFRNASTTATASTSCDADDDDYCDKNSAVIFNITHFIADDYANPGTPFQSQYFTRNW